MSFMARYMPSELKVPKNPPYVTQAVTNDTMAV